jgi:hypothetical protein
MNRLVLLLVLLTPGFAQEPTKTQLAPETCEGSWKLITSTKVPGSTVALRLSTAKDGQEKLQWANPKHDILILQIHRTKAPPNSKGEVELCTRGVVLTNGDESISLRDLQTALKLQPGYYIVRVRSQAGPSVVADTSDYIPIQIR